MGDLLELRRLRVMATHGCLPEEQARAQPFELDLDVEFDMAPAATSDAVGDTVDYGRLVDEVREAVTGGHFSLLEALAERVAQVVLADGRVASVVVAVRKLRPPVAADLATAGVRVTRTRG
ncbi:MAG TPA: dihydroneopterin aldolase [Acidimicrobiales bacterium]|nr:dihydroneopterin aldolase [Acidimicrobiales bacterium]